MTCDECSADDHLRADCLRHGQSQRSMFAALVPSYIQELGPLGDLFPFATEAPASTPETVQSYATTIPADQTTPIPRTNRFGILRTISGHLNVKFIPTGWPARGYHYKSKPCVWDMSCRVGYNHRHQPCRDHECPGKGCSGKSGRATYNTITASTHSRTLKCSFFGQFVQPGRITDDALVAKC